MEERSAEEISDEDIEARKRATRAQYSMEYRQAHPEKTREYIRTYMREYRLRNKEKLSKYNSEWTKQKRLKRQRSKKAEQESSEQ